MKAMPALLVLAAALLSFPRASLAAQTDEDAIALARSLLRVERHEAVAEALQLDGAESRAFWPLYDQYRKDMDKVNDRLVTVIRDYAKLYPNVSDERAKPLLKELIEIEEKRLDVRKSYLKNLGKILPAATTLRLAQVENRLDLAVQLKLASEVPLVPIEGRMSPEAVAATAYAEGVPGGVIVSTVELTALVTAIDAANRKVTLVSPDGFKKTVKVGPDAVNFDQIKTGDRVKVVATEELVIKMADPSDSSDDGIKGLVALAPKGAKPGGVMAETIQVTATVQAIDTQNQKVTLRFPDGSTRVLPVRKDIDLSKRKVGEKVLIRSTETLALGVQKL